MNNHQTPRNKIQTVLNNQSSIPKGYPVTRVSGTGGSGNPEIRDKNVLEDVPDILIPGYPSP